VVWNLVKRRGSKLCDKLTCHIEWGLIGLPQPAKRSETNLRLIVSGFETNSVIQVLNCLSPADITARQARCASAEDVMSEKAVLRLVS
jgi:hypothetical protein